VASKPSVTMTLAGDEKKLTDAFERVGRSSKAMADEVGSSGREMAETGGKLGALGERTDEAERRSLGFKDTLDGLTSGFATLGDSSLSTTEKIMGMGQAGADFFGGVTNFLLPTLGNLAGFLKGPLSTAMTFVSSHPLLIVVGLLAAAFVLLWTQSDKFREIVTGAFTAAGKFAREVFGTAIDWIVDRWNGLVGWFRSLPGRIGEALAGLGEAIAGAFKFALNLAIGYVNWWIDRANNLIYGINVINPFEDIPYIPHVPRLHTGGVFHSSTASGEGLALLRDGERVTPAGQGGGGGGPYPITVELVEQIQAWFNDGTLVLVGR